MGKSFGTHDHDQYRRGDDHPRALDHSRHGAHHNHHNQSYKPCNQGYKHLVPERSRQHNRLVLARKYQIKYILFFS